jgi:hypothetical protein
VTFISTPHRQVGAPDPNLKTSPILDDDERGEIEPEGSGAFCWFNGVASRAGDYVLSGHEVLRCESPGLWVRQGEVPVTDPGNT